MNRELSETEVHIITRIAQSREESQALEAFCQFQADYVQRKVLALPVPDSQDSAIEHAVIYAGLRGELKAWATLPLELRKLAGGK